MFAKCDLSQYHVSHDTKEDDYNDTNDGLKYTIKTNCT